MEILVTYIKQKSSIDALNLEYYPDSPEAQALNKRDIFLEPKQSALKSIEELERFIFV